MPCPTANWLYGTAVAKTVAPCTGRPPHAVIVKRSWIDCVDRVTARLIDALAISSRAGGVSWEIGMAPDPSGHPLGGTTPVAAEVAVVDPLLFRAVTRTRSV